MNRAHLEKTASTKGSLTFEEVLRIAGDDRFVMFFMELGQLRCKLPPEALTEFIRSPNRKNLSFNRVSQAAQRLLFWTSGEQIALKTLTKEDIPTILIPLVRLISVRPTREKHFKALDDTDFRHFLHALQSPDIGSKIEKAKTEYLARLKPSHTCGFTRGIEIGMGIKLVNGTGIHCSGAKAYNRKEFEKRIKALIDDSCKKILEYSKRDLGAAVLPDVEIYDLRDISVQLERTRDLTSLTKMLGPWLSSCKTPKSLQEAWIVLAPYIRTFIDIVIAGLPNAEAGPSRFLAKAFSLFCEQPKILGKSEWATRSAIVEGLGQLLSKGPALHRYKESALESRGFVSAVNHLGAQGVRLLFAIKENSTGQENNWAADNLFYKNLLTSWSSYVLRKEALIAMFAIDHNACCATIRQSYPANQHWDAVWWPLHVLSDVISKLEPFFKGNRLVRESGQWVKLSQAQVGSIKNQLQEILDQSSGSTSETRREARGYRPLRQRGVLALRPRTLTN